MNKKGSTPTFDLEKVKLYVSGPRSLIRTAKTATASLTETWAEYLHREFEISTKDLASIVVCSTTRKDGRSWQANVSEKIGFFVEKFTYAKQLYCVNVKHQTQASIVSTNDDKEIKLETNDDFVDTSAYTQRFSLGSGQQTQSSTVLPQPFVPSSSQTPTSSNQLRYSAAAMSEQHKKHPLPLGDYIQNPEDRKPKLPRLLRSIPQTPNEDQESVISIEPDKVGEINTDSDADCLEDSSDDDLIDDGSVVEKAKQRLGTFQPKFLKAVQDEVETLKTNGSWKKHIDRAPLSCFLLQTLFKK